MSGRNVAFSCSRLSNMMDEEDQFEVLGTPELEELVHLDGEPLARGLPKTSGKGGRVG